MPQVLLVGITADLQRQLGAALDRRAGLEATVLSGADEALARIAQDSAPIAAMLIGPAVPEPVALARRAHAVDDGLSVLLLPDEGDPCGVREAVRFAPHLGEDVSVLQAADPPEVAERVIEAAERRRARSAHARVTAALNPRISGSAAPPGVASDLGALLDQTPMGVVTVDGDCMIRGANRQARTLLGRPERELLGQALPRLFAPSEQDRARSHLDRAIRGLEPDRETFDRTEMAGEPQYLELSAVAAEVGGGTPGAIVLLQQVTTREQVRRERDRIEEALRQQRQWYEATVLGIGDAIIATDAEGCVTLMNPVAEQLTGWSQSDARGVDSRRVFDIVNESTGETVESPVTRVLQEGQIVGLANHTILRARDGRRLPIDDSGAPIRNSAGRITGVVLVFRDVSERRRAEQALLESEQRFRAIFEQAASGIALVSPRGTIVEVNERFCELVGYERDELLAMEDPVEALTHPDDLATDQAHSAALMTGEGESFQLEKRYIHKRGHAVWVRLTVSSLRDADGGIQQLIGVVEDMDERKRAEEALQASEERLRLILESLTSHAVFTMDRDGRIIDWNRGAERVLGYAEHEAVGAHGHIFFPEEARRAGDPGRELATALERGQASDDRWQVRRDGSYFWANGATYALADGGKHGFVKILRDQTEAKQVRDQLEARARQQATIAAFGQRALSGQPIGELLDEAARTVAETLGVDFCEVLRLLPDEHMLQLEARHGWPDDFGDAGRTKPERDSQAGYTMASDHPVVVEDLLTETRFTPPPLLRDFGIVSGMTVVIAAGEGGSPWGVLGAHSRERRRFTQDDVNFLQAIANTLAAAIGRGRTEQRLRELNQTLEQRVAERTAEIERRAAQLRALTSELTQTEQRERRRLAQALHDHLQQMLVAAKLQIGTVVKGVADEDGAAALARVGELLDKSIQESRSLTVELSPPVLYEAGLIAGLEWLGRWMKEQHGLDIDLHAGNDVDPAEDDLRVLLFQSARELLFNVVKHAAAERAEVDLERDEQQRIVLQVRDRGGGFDPAAAEPSADAEGGFGLFSIRERLVRLGGEVRVDSAPGEGTRITVAVPEDATAAAAEPVPRPVPAPEDSAPRLAEPEASGPRPPISPKGVIRVVIADDHAIVREGLVGVLNGQPDIEVVGEAGDGQAAVELVRQERPDVAVLDVTMPRMNGIEAARAISQEMPAIRLIGLSVHETSDMAGAMRNAGAAVYLNKAGPSNRLLAAIRGQALS